MAWRASAALLPFGVPSDHMDTKFFQNDIQRSRRRFSATESALPIMRLAPRRRYSLVETPVNGSRIPATESTRLPQNDVDHLSEEQVDIYCRLRGLDVQEVKPKKKKRAAARRLPAAVSLSPEASEWLAEFSPHRGSEPPSKAGSLGAIPIPARRHEELPSSESSSLPPIGIVQSWPPGPGAERRRRSMGLPKLQDKSSGIDWEEAVGSVTKTNISEWLHSQETTRDGKHRKGRKSFGGRE